MQKASLENIYQQIVNPTDELRSQISQIRIIQTLDKDKYRKAKTNLPYFVGGIFQKGIRRIENFAYTQYFIIDLDHLSSKGIDICQLKNKLITDNRIALMFISPSNDGLKIIFKLNEQCFDVMKYKMFYKTFAYKFAIQYDVNQVIDERTCDVTRACFIGVDDQAYFNPEPEMVKIGQFVDFLDFASSKKLINEIKNDQKNKLDENFEEKPSITDDVLSEIKLTLNVKNIKPKKEKEVYVPENLNNVIDKIKFALEENKLVVLQIENINYGKKIKVGVNHYWAELNVFYGKKGFSVVKTPKSGSNSELCEIAATIVIDVLF